MQYNIEPIMYVNTFTYYDLDIYRYYIGRKDQSVNTSSFVKNQDHHEKVTKYLIEYFTKSQNKYSKNKFKYIEMILLYLLYTHYTIFITYDSNHKSAYRKIKDFDKWFKNINPNLYENSNKYGLIRINRKTNFRHVKTNVKAFRKIYNIISKIRNR